VKRLAGVIETLPTLLETRLPIRSSLATHPRLRRLEPLVSVVDSRPDVGSHLAMLLIDCEEDKLLRAVLVGMLRELDR
jgi:hypothetical protein